MRGRLRLPDLEEQCVAEAQGERRVDTIGTHVADIDQDRSAAGDLAARDAAIAESAYGVSSQRTAGLEELRTSLDTASDAKQVMDIQARVGVENAHIQNDALQLQALRMRQESERRLQMQRDDEQDLADLSASLGGS